MILINLVGLHDMFHTLLVLSMQFLPSPLFAHGCCAMSFMPPRHDTNDATGGNRRHLFHFEGGPRLGDAEQQVRRAGQAAAAHGGVLVLRREGAADGGAEKRERDRGDKGERGTRVREKETNLVLAGSFLTICLSARI